MALLKTVKGCQRHGRCEDIRRHNEDVLTQCQEGDLLEIPRDSFSHWVVYAGDGRVIHRTGESIETAKIQEDSFWDVVGNSLAKINNYLDKKKTAMSGSEIVRRARSRIGDAGYNILMKNCEHFVTWCRYGEGFSEQVWNAVINVTYAAAAIIGTAIVVTFQTKRRR